MTLRSLIERHELIVCFGTGGVGKTTIAAALALRAAELGRRCAVVTIDPARALARAFGLERLPPEPERIAGLSVDGALYAAMLDQKSAWDSFIQRHARSPEIVDAIIGNDFYRQLSTHFAGAIEYAAIEQVCWLHETGRFDLIVLDTPAAAHAFDFVRAPERIDRLLDPVAARWLHAAAAESGWRHVFRRLERATGRQTLHSIAGLFGALETLLDDIQRRSQEARELLWSERSGFVLVGSARSQALAQAEALRATLRELGVPLRAVVFNRTHPIAEPLRAPGCEIAVERLLGALSDATTAAWIARTIERARELDRAEEAVIRSFVETEDTGITLARVPELDRDLHSLAALQAVARYLV
jgi:anion-transporting  ArsA/GET3 family ATPase